MPSLAGAYLVWLFFCQAWLETLSGNTLKFKEKIRGCVVAVALNKKMEIKEG